LALSPGNTIVANSDVYLQARELDSVRTLSTQSLDNRATFTTIHRQLQTLVEECALC
jgi:hypothetical protein